MSDEVKKLFADREAWPPEMKEAYDGIIRTMREQRAVTAELRRLGFNEDADQLDAEFQAALRKGPSEEEIEKERAAIESDPELLARVRALRALVQKK